MCSSDGGGESGEWAPGGRDVLHIIAIALVCRLWQVHRGREVIRRSKPLQRRYSTPHSCRRGLTRWVDGIRQAQEEIPELLIPGGYSITADGPCSGGRRHGKQFHLYQDGGAPERRQPAYRPEPRADCAVHPEMGGVRRALQRPGAIKRRPATAEVSRTARPPQEQGR